MKRSGLRRSSNGRTVGDYLDQTGFPVIECAITGFLVHVDDAVGVNGSYVDVDNYDELGYNEVRTPTPPHPLMKHRFRRRRRRRGR